ncbi:MAG: RHS repeat-associated core domain-containing protein [Bacteroidia bacterium]
MMKFTLSDRRRGARMYAPDEGRWKGVDALGEKYVGWSPYNYVMGNPIKFIDPDGEEIWIIGEDNNRYRYDGGKIYNASGDEVDQDKVEEKIQQLIGLFNQIGEAEKGGEILTQLTTSSSKYNFNSQKDPNAKGGMTTIKQSDGGLVNFSNLANIIEKAKGSFGKNIANVAGIDAVANELFHLFQIEHGEYESSLSSELQSTIFSRSIVESVEGDGRYLSMTSNFVFGTGKKGEELRNIVQNIENSNEINPSSFKLAIRLYKASTEGRNHQMNRMLKKGDINAPTLNRLLPLKK